MCSGGRSLLAAFRELGSAIQTSSARPTRPSASAARDRAPAFTGEYFGIIISTDVLLKCRIQWSGIF